jgi:hypothetical protein
MLGMGGVRTALGAAATVAALAGCGATPAADPAPSASSSSTVPSTPGSPTAATSTPSAKPKREGAAAHVPREVILHQLAMVAERIAKHVPMTEPTPVDISPGSNRALGFHLLIQFGFRADQWAYLDALWTRESGWNEQAENASSGAYGIPQSLPATKMAVVGKDWRTNPDTQIRWGLAYIAARYGNPQGAWAHSQKFGWY